MNAFDIFQAVIAVLVLGGLIFVGTIMERILGL
jgi:hypothetical protein